MHHVSLHVSPRNMSAAGLARALGARKVGATWMARCPAHDDRDPSLAIGETRNGKVLVYCHAGCDQRDVIAALRSRSLWPAGDRRPIRYGVRDRVAPPPEDRDIAARIAAALRLWGEAGDPRGTVVESYLASRGLALPADVAGDVIRHHPAVRIEDARCAAMIALLRDVRTDEPCGIHRTYLDTAGRKLGRRMLGRATRAAIKIDADAHIHYGLTIGEGVETCLAARAAGLRPVWALGSAGAIAAFDALAGVDALTLLAERDEASARAVDACADRWLAAGREVLIVRPRVGSDIADVWREAAR